MKPHLLSILILFVPSMLIMAAMIRHSMKNRPRSFTLIYFIGGFFFFFAREFVGSETEHADGLPQYYHTFQFATLAGVPISVIFGWFIITYLSLCFAEKICDQTPAWRGRLFPLFPLAWIHAASMSFAIEATGLKLGWWAWARQDYLANEGTFSQYLQGVPFIALQGWASMTLWVWMPLLIIGYTQKRYNKSRFLILPALIVYEIGAAHFNWETKMVVYPLLLLLALFHPARIQMSRK